MSTDLHKTASQESADFQAMVDHAFRGKPVDPDVSKRVNERADRVREELRQRAAIDNSADLIREAREEL